MIKDLRAVFESMVSVTELSRGKASKVVQEVAEEGKEYIIVKNNEPQAVLISIKEYTQLMNDHEKANQLQEELENLELTILAEERIRNINKEDILDEKEVLKELGISAQDVQALIDTVEIE